MVGEQPPAEGHERARERLVADLRRRGRIRSEPVAAAFSGVPRHLFLEGLDPALAYRDDAIPTRWDEAGRPTSSSSQPSIMAIMLEQLEPGPGQRILEVGAGTGYNAALLGALTGPQGTVVSVDIDAEVAAAAERHLAAAGAGNVRTLAADGAQGSPADAPFDRIIVTAAAWDLAPAWSRQLAPGGRLVLPLSLRGVQYTVALRPMREGFESTSVAACGFMPLRGPSAGPERIVALGASGLTAELPDDRRRDGAAVAAWLAEPPTEEVALGIDVTENEIWGSLALWIALGDPEACRLSGFGEAADTAVAPLIRLPGQSLTHGLLGARGVAALVAQAPGRSPFALSARGFGPGGAALAGRLAGLVESWEHRGRPSGEGMRVVAVRPGAPLDDADAIVDKRHWRLGVSWKRERGPGGFQDVRCLPCQPPAARATPGPPVRPSG